MRRLFQIMLLQAALATAALTAPPAAPLPPDWTHEHDDEGENEYRPAPAVDGTYGHGFYGVLNLAPEQPPGSPPVCVGDAAAQAEFVRRAGSYFAEFWFYSTGAQGVLFAREFRHDPQRPCARGPAHIYTMERAYAADGFIHVIELDRDGDPALGYSRPATETPREYSGSFSPLQSLMAREQRPLRGRRSSRRVGGFAAECWTISGLAWSDLCLSRARGPTYGMILLAGAGDDVQPMFHLHFEELRPRARLDGRLFELDRHWRGPD